MRNSYVSYNILYKPIQNNNISGRFLYSKSIQFMERLNNLSIKVLSINRLNVLIFSVIDL